MTRAVRLFLFILGVVALVTGAFMASTPLGISTAGALVAWAALQLERTTDA